MNRQNFFYGFQFNYYQIFHDQIRPKTEIKRDIFIMHGYPNLFFTLQPRFLQFICEYFKIY